MEKPSVMESWANDALCCANDAGLDAEVGGIKPAANSGRDLLAVLNRRTAEAAEIDPEAPLEAPKIEAPKSPQAAAPPPVSPPSLITALVATWSEDDAQPALIERYKNERIEPRPASTCCGDFPQLISLAGWAVVTCGQDVVVNDLMHNRFIAIGVLLCSIVLPISDTVSLPERSFRRVQE